jgi:hypothetical protein
MKLTTLYFIISPFPLNIDLNLNKSYKKNLKSSFFDTGFVISVEF